MKTTFLLKKIGIWLFAFCTLYGLSSCHKNKYENPVTKAPVPVATDNWTKLNAPNEGINVLEVANNTIYAGAGNTLYVSKDEGATWTSSKVGTADLADITAIKVFKNNIYLGTGRAGVFRSTDGGKTWVNNNASLFDTDITSFAEREGNLYVASDGNGVFALNQTSGTWDPFSNKLPRAFTSYLVFKIINTDSTLVAAAGVNTTFYHFDFKNNEWVESRLPKVSSYLVDIIYDKGAIMGIGSEGKLLRSKNTGINWTYDTLDIQSALPASNINEKLYVGSLNYYVLKSRVNGGWVQQRDKTAAVGSSWANGQTFLPKTRLNGIVEFNNKLFLATDSGLFIKKL